MGKGVRHTPGKSESCPSASGPVVVVTIDSEDTAAAAAATFMSREDAVAAVAVWWAAVVLRDLPGPEVLASRAPLDASERESSRRFVAGRWRGGAILKALLAFTLSARLVRRTEKSRDRDQVLGLS
jgi:hypothetical protein